MISQDLKCIGGSPGDRRRVRDSPACSAHVWECLETFLGLAMELGGRAHANTHQVQE